MKNTKASPVDLKKIEDYYSEKINVNGATPAGVDWNGPESQVLRFEQLSRLLPKTDTFTLLDYGCGYGALYDYLVKAGLNFDYVGFDRSPAMIAAAQQAHTGMANATWSEVPSTKPIDYVFASGLFNVKLDHSEAAWNEYIFETLEQIASLANKGFAYNLLTSFSDADKQKPYLFYADPMKHFDYCKKNFSRNVALLHDYNLYEFTIHVRGKN